MTKPSFNARPIRSVLVGTDFSTCSAAAVSQALRIAGWSGAQVHVVHVIDTTVVIEIEDSLSNLQQNIRASLIKDAQAEWTRFASTIPGGAAGLAIEVEINNRVAGILNRAHQVNADILVMGVFGDRKPDVGVGTIASGCVRRSLSDVLLVRETHTSSFRRIVAAVDFSEGSLRALTRAADFASMDGAEVHALHVTGSPWRALQYLTNPDASTSRPEAETADRAKQETRLSDFIRPIVAAFPAVRFSPALIEEAGHRSGIVEYARTVSADLIALGTRGRSNLHDILLGSTAEKVLTQSPCSILAVKPD